ncbi:hypothetical protein AYI70_g92 [Smittium culicis]|uniref:Uncharacterized protein n=1 Tax=Smittium culicis TaxID=133412 RepID=A0A1R1YI06_9FUNG|nr:hypothetical protein AYI70_g92 [Smittium culicis]
MTMLLELSQDKTQDIIDQLTKAYESGGGQGWGMNYQMGGAVGFVPPISRPVYIPPQQPPLIGQPRPHMPPPINSQLNSRQFGTHPPFPQHPTPTTPSGQIPPTLPPNFSGTLPPPLSHPLPPNGLPPHPMRPPFAGPPPPHMLPPPQSALLASNTPSRPPHMQGPPPPFLPPPIPPHLMNRPPPNVHQLSPHPDFNQSTTSTTTSDGPPNQNDVNKMDTEEHQMNSDVNSSSDSNNNENGSKQTGQTNQNTYGPGRPPTIHPSRLQL